MKEQVHLYFTSDLHSHFENWPKILHYIKRKAVHHQKADEDYFLLDNGDHLDRFHPITEASLGKSNVDLLNRGGYQAVTIGNNEGITLPSSSFTELYNHAQFDVVCANLVHLTAMPDWLKPYTILKTKSGIRIGVLGLTAPFNAFYKHLGWRVDSPYETLNQYLPELKNQCDIVILLSHLGLSEDEQIAMLYEEIDIIIGGHTHHLFKQGQIVNNTLLCAVGKWGFYVGEIHLDWDHDKKTIISKQAFAIETDQEDDDYYSLIQIESLEKSAREKLRQPVAKIDTNYDVDWFKEYKLIVKLTETLREWTSADCSMLNAGLILEGLPKGVITKGDIHRICPHPINPVTVTLTGESMLEMIRMVYTKRFREIPLKGFGFRGKLIGRMVFANIEVKTNTDKDDNERILAVTIGGKPLEPEKEYKLATADMFTFGNLLPTIARARNKQYYMPEFLRDLLLVSIDQMNRNF